MRAGAATNAIVRLGFIIGNSLFEGLSWGGRTRTSNFPVNSRAVCQLTYTPMPPYHPPHREQPTVTDAQTHSGEQVREGKKSAPPEPLGAGGARSQSSRDAYPGRVPEFGVLLRFDSSRANVSMGSNFIIRSNPEQGGRCRPPSGRQSRPTSPPSST